MKKGGDNSRRRKFGSGKRELINAAIRHAENVARTTGTAEPVIFRPRDFNESVLRGASDAPSNPLLREVLMQALGIPKPLPKVANLKPKPPSKRKMDKPTITSSKGVNQETHATSAQKHKRGRSYYSAGN